MTKRKKEATSVAALTSYTPRQRRTPVLKRSFSTDEATFTSGEEAVTVRLADLPIEVKVAAALYGISRRVDGKNGLAIARQIAAGQWPGGGTVKAAGRKPPIICEALVRVTGLPLEQVHAKWLTLSPEERKQVQRDFRVQATLKILRAERLQSKSSVAALFGALASSAMPATAPPHGGAAPGAATEPLQPSLALPPHQTTMFLASKKMERPPPFMEE